MIRILEVIKTSGRSSDTRPFINISTKGYMDIGPSAIKLLDIYPGDMVNIAYDDKANTYYVFKCSPDHDGYLIRIDSTKKRLMTNAKAVIDRIIKDYGLYVLDKKSFRKLLDEVPVEQDGLKLFRIKQTEKDIKV
jgi:hypothetical protein